MRSWRSSASARAALAALAASSADSSGALRRARRFGADTGSGVGESGGAGSARSAGCWAPNAARGVVYGAAPPGCGPRTVGVLEGTGTMASQRTPDVGSGSTWEARRFASDNIASMPPSSEPSLPPSGLSLLRSSEASASVSESTRRRLPSSLPPLSNSRFFAPGERLRRRGGGVDAAAAAGLPPPANPRFSRHCWKLCRRF
mmetsp:Transcript_75509/g.136090  ORF Transcript_75509/g.136090 Transcript_75509/m.136090 type:complete len:202 (-) Transcript_75509:255-860(-)